MHLGAHVLLPEGFDEHPDARYPLVIFHGHFPQTFGGFREEPPDPNLKPEYSERFHLEGYNRIEQELAHQFYKEWTGPGYPRMVIIEIQHANPYYDDSYAVNSENLGPYGDAITYELIPYLEKKYRCLGTGWSRFLYGGSTGGWEALAAQVFYPDEYNGCFAACPDPIDFRAYTVVDHLQGQERLLRRRPWHRVARPGMRNYLGHVSIDRRGHQPPRAGARHEEPVGPAVGHLGGRVLARRPRRLSEADLGQAAPASSTTRSPRYWREHYDLGHIIERDWPKIGKKLEGKIHIYVGDMDNYYLNNAVYLIGGHPQEDRRTRPTAARSPTAIGRSTAGTATPPAPTPSAACAITRCTRPKIVERLLKTAPPGGDVKSWRY